MSEGAPPDDGTRKGPLRWMAHNPVAANLMMVILLAGGVLMLRDIKQEVFPEVTRDAVRVAVAYPGASPEEVEQGVLLAVEEAIRGIEGVKEIRADASEGLARVTADLVTGADRDRALNDITAAVGRITSLPQDAERPIISLSTNRREVITLILHGQVDRRNLEALAEDVRRQLISKPNISVVEIAGVPPPEISIEVPQRTLREYDLTLEEIASAVRRASVDLPGGTVRTNRGEVLLRTTERREFGSEFRDIAIKSRPDGSKVTLGEIATIEDTYRETGEAAFFDGEPAIQLKVFRIGEQTPMGVSEAVKELVKSTTAPAGVTYTTWNDRAEIYRDRLHLLLKNSAWGLLLVLCMLGLFLRARLAFWVTMGIVISFVGALLFMPALGVSINMISLFAFLLALGIVVDDAIVVGEAAHNARTHTRGPLEAAIAGTREVAMPVVFAVLTTIVAFCPLLFVPGTAGQLFTNIPLIVIPILLLSLVEALFILPAHLGHSRPSESGFLYRISAPQRRFSVWIEHVIERHYRPFVTRVVRYRYITLAASLGLLLVVAGVLGGDLIKFNFFPKIEGDRVSVALRMPVGTSIEDTRRAVRRITAAAREVIAEHGGDDVSRGIYTQLGAVFESRGGGGGRSSSGRHLGQVVISLVPVDQRDFTASDLSRAWRQKVGTVPGAERLNFEYNIGPGQGAPVGFELRHGDRHILQRAAEDAAATLRGYEGVHDVDDGFDRGKAQLDLTLRPAARALGVTEAGLARQIRNAYYGAEVLRDQRGRDELRVYVRRPLDERESMYHLEEMLIQAPGGGEIPLAQAANVERGRAYTEIERENGGRAVDLSADVDIETTTPNRVMRDIYDDVIPGLLQRYPGLTWEKSGQQLAQAEAFQALSGGLTIALLVMYALMAVVFRSYVQPIAILVAIPFGVVGALGGHLLMGYNLSLVSVLGMVALSGVVVNDSLVLIATANVYRREGKSTEEAVVDAGARRFRPIWLTSLTTFFGLSPMILESSVQARFLVPMAISLGFGVLFVTVIALVIIPALYVALDDAKTLRAGAAKLTSQPAE